MIFWKVKWWPLFLFILSSCSLFTKKGDWGKEAFSSFTGERFKSALVKNVKSPHVWAPAGSALVVHWAGYDQKISDWASEHKPIYGEQTTADNWSDNFNDVLLYEMYLSPLFTASSAWGKAKGYGVIYLSSSAADYAHDALADGTNRERPNKEDHRSFPSGHSTQAGTRNIITMKNLEAVPMSSDLRFGFDTVNTTMAAGVMWARVEGKRHYPSDVLAGYALGAFVSGFLYDFLMYENADHAESVALLPSADKWTMMYSYAF